MAKLFINIFNLPVKVIEYTRNWNYGVFSEFRNELFGIAILGVMLAHGLSLYFSVPIGWLQKLLTTSSTLVFTQGFLFLSGIGLWFAFNKGVTLKTFYLKRLFRIFMPWTVIAIPLFFILNICFDRDIIKFIVSCSTLSFWVSTNNGTWYISLTIVLYLIFPILYKLFKKNGLFTFSTINILYFLFLLTLRYLDEVLFNRLSIGLSQVPSFFTGIYLGHKVSQGSKPRLWCYLLVFMFFLAFKYLQEYDKIFAGYYFILQRLISSALLCIPLSFIKTSLLSKILRFCGSISLELYLSHILLIPIFKHFNTYYNNFLLSSFPVYHGFTEYLFIISVSFGVSFLYKFGFEKMLKK